MCTRYTWQSNDLRSGVLHVRVAVMVYLLVFVLVLCLDDFWAEDILDVAETKAQGRNAVLALKLAFFAKLGLNLLSRPNGADRVRVPDFSTVRVRGRLQRRKSPLSCPIAVVAVIAPGIELVVLEVNLHDAALQVVEIRALLEQLFGLFDGHRSGVIVHKSHSLWFGCVVERSQNCRLVETFQINCSHFRFSFYMLIPNWIALQTLYWHSAQGATHSVRETFSAICKRAKKKGKS